jgi:hypothetical protein
MRRVQLIELHDQPWFPGLFRNYVTESVQLFLNAGNLYRPIVHLLRKALEAARTRKVVDLCSGSGGPWPWLSQTDELTRPSPVEVCLTDKFPNAEALARSSGSSGRIQFHPESVDATHLPEGLKGFRTMFTAFHHFPPREARAILSDAVEKQQGIGIFEAPGRHVSTIFLVCLIPLGYLLLVPFIRPFRWSRLFWTYILPVIPLAVWFDGIVSCLRAYSTTELRELTQGISSDQYRWEIGEENGQTLPARVTYLIGYPVADLESAAQ